MADPKYAGLPGIVYDQPDIYETSELPESEQDYLPSEDAETNDTVEMLHVSANDAYQRFKGKSLDSSKVDFSDRISRRPRTGYSTRRIEWDLAGEGEEETVVQRYQRLQCEVNQLMQDMAKIKDDVQCGDGVVSAVELGKQVEALHSTLLHVKLEEQLGAEVVGTISNPQLAAHKKLCDLLEGLKKIRQTEAKGAAEKTKPSDKIAKKAAAPGSAAADGVTYELFYSPEVAQLNQLGQAVTLEKRIEQMETLIGNNPDKLSRLWTWTREGSLIGAVQALGRRLALLEPTQLDHIEGRLHAVHTKINAINEKSTAITEANQDSKITELYELMQKSEVLCSALPEVVDRLVSLQALHEEAQQFSRSLKQLDVTQTQLNSVLSSNAELLASVQDKFATNLSVINNNISSLDARIQALDKR